MGINKFLFFLLIFSIILIFYDIEQIDTKNNKHEKPLVSFYDSTLYDINEKSVKSVVKSDEAYFYKSREEMVSGTFVIKENQKDPSSGNHIITGDNIVKIKNNVYFDGNVSLEMANGLHLKTEQLEYNINSKILKNQSKFVATKDFHDFHGENLHFNIKNKSINSKKVEFKIKVEYGK